MVHHEVLYADEDIIATHKNPGTPCQSRNHTNPPPLDITFPAWIQEEVTLWNRLDQPASGLLLWKRPAPAPKYTRFEIQEKMYLAIVEGHPTDSALTLTSRLTRDGRKHRAVSGAEDGKTATLHYRLIHPFDRYSLLEVRLETGRFHQIRKQLADAGHPVKGDVKYGARRGNRDRSIDLHALAYTIRKDDECITIKDRRLRENNTLWDWVKEHHLHRF